MKPKVITACIIIFAIPLAGIFFHGAIVECCDETSICVRGAIELRETPESVVWLNKAVETWKGSEDLLTSFVTHEEVDEVYHSLVRAISLYGIEEPQEYMEALSETLARIEVVRAFDLPTVRSIF